MTFSAGASVRVFVTASGTDDRLTEKTPIRFRSDSLDATPEEFPSVFIDPSKCFQTIEGFGGAFTEAAATTLSKLAPANRAAVMKAYFDPAEGNGYTLCRTHINSCDFSLGNYAYDETPGDTELEHFSVARDEKFLIPMIREASSLSGGKLRLFASPWSPPPWMKTNGIMNNGGRLLPEYRRAWAGYFVRYIREYRQRGIDIWGITVQNEPAATQKWDSCVYSAGEERDFVRDHLGPALAEAGFGDVKVMIWDHNRDHLIRRVSPSYSDPEASKYIWGTAFHWYGEDKFENLELHHDAWPDKKLLFSEGCQEGGPHTGSWNLGERYGRSIINDLNRWTVAWVDWNLLLDEQGGPNHVGNFCSAPILADTVNDKPLFQNSYYYIGHFSRFMRPGARRILCATSMEALESTACVNSDGSVAVAVMNRTEKKIPFRLDMPGSDLAVEAPPRSITTYLISN